MVSTLPDDLWSLILGLSWRTAVQCRGVSHAFKAIIEDGVLCGLVVRSDSDRVNQKELLSILALKAEEARELPHKAVKVGRFCVEHRFRLSQVVPKLRTQWAELGRRQRVRESRRRKRAAMRGC